MKRMPIFLRVLALLLSSLLLGGAVSTSASAQQFRWVWTTSLNLGGPGPQGPSVDPVDLCKRIKAGITSLYYQGIWFSHLEYYSPTYATCWDHHDEIIAGQPREDQKFDINRTCVRFNEDGSTATVSSWNCEVPCPCEWTVGNPIVIQSLVNVERSEDFLSALDPRFSFLRNYRSDAPFIGATAGFDPFTGNSGLGAFSLAAPGVSILTN